METIKTEKTAGTATMRAQTERTIAETPALGIASLATFASMGDAIRTRIALSPEHVAINDLDANKTYTCAEIGRRVDWLCDVLKQKDAGPGDSVITNLDNSSDLIFLIFAALTSGMRLALIESQTPPGRLRHFFDLVRPRATFLSAASAAEAGPLQCEMPWNQTGASQDQHRPGVKIDPNREREAFVIFSSGTTGDPKGIVHTHGNIIAELDSMIRAHAFRAAMNHYLVLPLAHASGLYRSLIMPFFTGGTVYFRRQFEPRIFWSDVQAREIDFVQLVPSHVAILNRAKDGPNERLRLQFVGTASGYLSPKEQLAFEQRFRVPILQGYGLTECTCGIVLNSRDSVIRRPGVAGIPLDVNQIKVVDNAGIEVERGEVGEIFVRGKNVATHFLGYQGPEFDSGWMKTGDMGRFDELGNIVLVGRKTNIINRGAYKIYALEIEEALAGVPGVDEAAVIGVPHAVLGQDIVAFVALNRSAEPAQLLGALRPKLSSFKIPSQIIPIDKMPKNRLGKIVKDDLLKIYTERRNTGGFVDEAAILSRLCRLVADVFATDAANVEADSSRETIAQWDSLGHVQILAAIEQTFGVRMADEAAIAAQSVRDLANAIVHALRTKSTQS